MVLPVEKLTPEEKVLNGRIIKEGLHVKHDHQLELMRTLHARKLERLGPSKQKVDMFPDTIRWGLFRDGVAPSEWEAEVVRKRAYFEWKQDRLAEIVELIEAEIAFRRAGKVKRSPIGTTYYIDSDNGDDGANDGTSAVKTNGDGPWATLHQFTENARVAGDIAILRRGRAASYDDAGSLAFTSDGNPDNPIFIEADYDDAWGDFANSTQTYTMVFGAKAHTASGAIGDIAAGDWVYVTGDDQREFSYEVASVVDATLTLYLPFKGTTGAGKTLVIMPDAPEWGTDATFNGQWAFEGDNFWKAQGIKINSTRAPNILISDSIGHIFKDMAFIGNGAANDYVISSANGPWYGQLVKCRVYDECGIYAPFMNARAEIWNCLFDGNNVADSWGVRVEENAASLVLIDTEFKNHALGDIRGASGAGLGAALRGRNVVLSSGVQIYRHELVPYAEFLFEDFGGTPMDTRQLTYESSANDTPSIQSEGTIVRVGGATRSIKVTPGASRLATAWEMSRLKLFELPIYMTTASKTLTVYFRPGATADWTADPLATELWAELEYWNHATNNFRTILKSTGVINMNGDTSWQALTVTASPAQVGVAYFRVWYAKAKEAGDSNVFYCDPLVEIT